MIIAIVSVICVVPDMYRLKTKTTMSPGHKDVFDYVGQDSQR